MRQDRSVDSSILSGTCLGLNLDEDSLRGSMIEWFLGKNFLEFYITIIELHSA